MVHFDAPTSPAKEADHSEQAWLGRAVDGFIDAGKDALKHPGDTAVMVGTGLGVGALIQTGFNRAEHMGGRIGAVAKVGKVALVVGTAGLAALNIATAEDSARETGKMAFDTGLFLGAAKLGTFADRMPLIGNHLQPKAVTEVSKGILDFRVIGDKVDLRVADRLGLASPEQVRLSNGKGFIARFNGKTDLIDMPKEIPGVGTLEYGRTATTLTSPNGQFSRELVYGKVSTKLPDGSSAHTVAGKDIGVTRANGDRVSFGQFGDVSVSQGRFESGNSWTFAPDGSFSMRSLPAGKYKIDVDANDVATSIYTHGSSRSIRGMVRSSNYKPLEREVTTAPFVRGSGVVFGRQIPDITPVHPSIREDLASAKVILDKVANNYKVFS